MYKDKRTREIRRKIKSKTGSLIRWRNVVSLVSFNRKLTV